MAVIWSATEQWEWPGEGEEGLPGKESACAKASFHGESSMIPASPLFQRSKLLM